MSNAETPALTEAAEAVVRLRAAIGRAMVGQTTVIDQVLVALVALGLLVTLMRRRAEGVTAALRADIERLRGEAEAMRLELAALRPEDTDERQRALDARLRGVVRRVAELESQLPRGNGRH